MIHHIDSPWQLQWCRLGNIGVCFICYSVLRCGVVALLAGCAAVSQLFWLCLGNPPTHHIPTPNPFCRSVRLSLHPSVVCFSLTEQNHDCNVQHKQNMSRTNGPPGSLFPCIMDSLQLFFSHFCAWKLFDFFMETASETTSLQVFVCFKNAVEWPQQWWLQRLESHIKKQKSASVKVSLWCMFLCPERSLLTFPHDSAARWTCRGWDFTVAFPANSLFGTKQD